MNSLRLILLLTGLVAIGIIYFWETAGQRLRQRKQSIGHVEADSELSDLRITPRLDIDADISGAISDLNSFLGKSKQQDEISITDQPFCINTTETDTQIPVDATAPAVEDHPDLFAAVDGREDERDDEDLPPGKSDAVAHERIITLYITAPPVETFTGREILDAMDRLSLQYGDMGIFHHFGLGNMRGEEALFSLVDMFEPGSFDLDKMGEHKTRGLSLFMCLPTAVDAQIVFELMLNTAQRLSGMLGGEIRGQDHKLMNDDHLLTIREIINNFNE